jgi:hypothetical protein
MSKAQAKRVFRPQGLAVVLGMGALSVAIVGLLAAAAGFNLNSVGELVVAGIGMLGGAKAVLAA